MLGNSQDFPTSSSATTPVPRRSHYPDGVDDASVSEMLLMVHNFLQSQSCTEAARALREEVDRKGLLGQQLSILTSTQERETFDHFSRNRSNACELLRVVSRLRDISMAPAPIRLAAPDGFSLLDSTAAPPPRRPMFYRNPMDTAGMRTRDIMKCLFYGTQVPPQIRYSQETSSDFKLHARIHGHMGSTYCCTFDLTGRYVITGADDNLVKVWDTKTCLLRYTFRGHSAEVCDMAVSPDNVLLASCSNDKTARVWSLRTGGLHEIVREHHGDVVSVLFPDFIEDNTRYLVTLSTDGSIVFCAWDARTHIFGLRTRFDHREPGNNNTRIQAGSSSRGRFIVFGDNHKTIYIYRMAAEGVTLSAEIPNAQAEQIHSLAWSHKDLRFLAADNGIVKLWDFKYNAWKGFQFPVYSLPVVAEGGGAPKLRKNRIYTIAWSRDDAYVVIAMTDALRVFDSATQTLTGVLEGHKTVHSMRAHPTKPKLFVTVGYEGCFMVWDLTTCESLCKIVNLDFNVPKPIFDVAIARNGTLGAFVDEPGHISVIGIALNSAARRVPSQQFFSTDYHRCINDANGVAIDENTRMLPNLQDPPILCRIDFIPHGDEWQQRVPGRAAMMAYDGPPRRPGYFCPWQREAVVPALPMSEVIALEHGTHADIALLDQTFGEESCRLPPSNWFDEPAAVPKKKKPVRVPTPPVAPAPLSPRSMARALPDSDSNDSDYSGEEDTVSVSDVEGSTEELQAELLIEDDNDSDYIEGRGDAHPTVFRQSRRRRRRRQREREQDQAASASRATSNRPRRERVERDRYSADESSQQTAASRRRAPNRHTRANPAPEVDDAVESQRRRQRRQESAAVVYRENDGEGEDAGPGPSTLPEAPRRRMPPKYAQFPMWMRQVTRRRFPYLAQIGDRVVYFPQGHARYLAAVNQKKLYRPPSRDYPRPEFNCQEFAIVDNVEYRLKPFRLILVTLGLVDEAGRRTGIKCRFGYHDFENVPDFMILRDHYDRSLAYNFAPGNAIEAIIDEKWWTGTVDSRCFDNPGDFNGSQFCSVVVTWDNGEAGEHCSPWDMQPLTPDRASGVDATPAEMVAFSYFEPATADWPLPDGAPDLGPRGERAREFITERVLSAITQLLTVPELTVFHAPVDLSEFSDYALVVPCPMDLQTLTERISNKYHRTLRQLQLEIQMIAKNAIDYNITGAPIILNAMKLVETLFAVIERVDVTDPKVYLETLAEATTESLEAWKRPLSLEPPRVNVSDVSAEGEGIETNPAAQVADDPGHIWINESLQLCNSLLTGNSEHMTSLREVLGSTLTRLADGGYSTPTELFDDISMTITDYRDTYDKRNAEYRHLSNLSIAFCEGSKRVIDKFERMQRSRETRGRYQREAAMRAHELWRPTRTGRNGSGNGPNSSSVAMHLRERPFNPNLRRSSRYRDNLDYSVFNSTGPSTSADVPWAGEGRRTTRHEEQQQLQLQQPPVSRTRARIVETPSGDEEEEEEEDDDEENVDHRPDEEAGQEVGDQEEDEDEMMAPEEEPDREPLPQAPQSSPSNASAGPRDSDYEDDEEEEEEVEDDEEAEGVVPEPPLSSDSESTARETAASSSEEAEVAPAQRSRRRPPPRRTRPVRTRNRYSEDDEDDEEDEEPPPRRSGRARRGVRRYTSSEDEDDDDDDDEQPARKRKRTNAGRSVVTATRGSTRRRRQEEVDDDDSAEENYYPTRTRSGRQTQRPRYY